MRRVHPFRITCGRELPRLTDGPSAVIPRAGLRLLLSLLSCRLRGGRHQQHHHYQSVLHPLHHRRPSHSARTHSGSLKGKRTITRRQPPADAPVTTKTAGDWDTRRCRCLCLAWCCYTCSGRIGSAGAAEAAVVRLRLQPAAAIRVSAVDQNPPRYPSAEVGGVALGLAALG